MARATCQAGLVELSEPRSLSPTESAILDALLAPDFDGASELRAQAAQTQVVGRCDCGCPTIDLAVTGNAPAALHNASGPAPFEGIASDAEGQAIGDILLFVADGYLSSLEYVSHAEPPPSDWPAAARVSLLGPLR